MNNRDYNTKAVMYARFSTDKQTELSIEAQFRACREYAERNGLQIVGSYKDEAVSGRTNKRIEYQRMIRDAKKAKFDIILIHKYDRIARNLGEHVNLAAKLEDLGVSLVAVAQDFGTGKEAKLMRSIQWILSEYYSDNLAEETRKGLKEIALKGMTTGGVPPFGYDIKDHKYAINPVEAPYVKRFFEACRAHQSYAPILRELNSLGITGKRGKPMRRNSVTEILHNEKYTGTHIYSPVEEKNRSDRRTKPNAIRVENAHPAIISKELFDEVQKIMISRKNIGHRKHPLAGLIYCSCGSKMYLHTSKSKGWEHTYFHCDKKCGGNIKVETVEKAAAEYVRMLTTPKYIKTLTDAINKYNSDEAEMLRAFEADRKAKIAAKSAEIDALMQNMTNSTLPPAVMAEIGRKMDSLIKEKERIEQLKPMKHYEKNVIESWLTDVLRSEDQDITRLLIEKIIVTKNGDNPEIEVISTISGLVVRDGCGGIMKYIPRVFQAWITTGRHFESFS